MIEPYFYVLLRDLPARADIPKLYSDNFPHLALAKVLARDARWADIMGATLLVREEPTPVLAAMGYLDAAQRARIEALPQQVKRALTHLRYVDYRQAEQDCQRLADRLVSTIGEQALNRFRFVGIPRGGLIVLGMLAYALDLSPEQLTFNPEAPLVIVDDCAISGARFKQFLSDQPNQPVVFASLYAHPALRQAITTRESRVTTCVSAHDLHDYAPAYHQDDYASWQARWQARSGDRLYWLGLPEHICFAWSEPDNSFWNPITEREEPGWRVVPGAYCLKNRAKNRQPAARVQLQPRAHGELKPGANVLFGEMDEEVIVANMETEETICLTDVAADMWRAIIGSAHLEVAAQELIQLYDVDPTVLTADLDDFAKVLQAKGLLAE